MASATKTTAKWAKGAAPGELLAECATLELAKAAERNPMIRSSLSQRIEIINREFSFRNVPCAVCAKPIQRFQKFGVGSAGASHLVCPGNEAIAAPQ